jgi:predicted ATPase
VPGLEKTRFSEKLVFTDKVPMFHLIHHLTINGFKSIRRLEQFKLHDLNILIGSNGSGKSNFVSYFRMLAEMVEGRLQLWVSQQGGADRILSFGVKNTPSFESSIEFGVNGYKFALAPTINGGLSFVTERIYFEGEHKTRDGYWYTIGSGHNEANIKNEIKKRKVAEYSYNSISNWKVYHFHDTGDTAGMKRLGAVHDNAYLRSDASNLAAFLYRLLNESPDIYEEIRRTVRLAIPFFDDFSLKPQPLKTGEEQIRLLWQQKGSDYPLWPSQLSDGSLRFICLVTALLQPIPPSTIIIDEPELGLHPYAITLLGALLRSASQRMQVIVSTQSVPLLNEFSLSDLIVVERENDETVFKRLNEQDFAAWLEDYSIGELWEKNILGGRPQR